MVINWGMVANPAQHQSAYSLTQAECAACLWDALFTPAFRDCIHPNCYASTRQSRVHEVMQLRSRCVHLQEHAGTGPIQIIPWSINLSLF